MQVEVAELQTNETDDRGRFYLGTEYANKRVTIAIVDVETTHPDEEELADAYRNVAGHAADLAEEWVETYEEEWLWLDE